MAYQDEKAEEKQEEKPQEEKLQEEKSGEKNWQRDTLGGTIWALILIWAGVVLLVMTLNISFFEWLDWDKAWGAILIGAALLLATEIAARLMIPSYAAPLRGRIILASILGIMGLSNFINVELWPLIIIAIGLSLLLRGFTHRSR